MKELKELERQAFAAMANDDDKALYDRFPDKSVAEIQAFSRVHNIFPTLKDNEVERFIYEKSRHPIFTDEEMLSLLIAQDSMPKTTPPPPPLSEEDQKLMEKFPGMTRTELKAIRDIQSDIVWLTDTEAHMFVEDRERFNYHTVEELALFVHLRTRHPEVAKPMATGDFGLDLAMWGAASPLNIIGDWFAGFGKKK